MEHDALTIPIIDPSPTVGTDGALSSTPPPSSYQHSFILGEGSLLATAFLRMYRKGNGERVADSLRKALMLLEDVHFWEDVVDKDLVLNLKWHSIVVSIFLWPFFS